MNIECPHCVSSVSAGEFCPNCGKILPAAERSYFEVLGYDKEILNLDLADLEKRFFALSRKLHPDRFAAKSPLEVELSHEHSSAINNAYRTLKDPVARAKYIVELKLGSIEEKSAKVPPEMADLFFEVQDHLDAIREADGERPESAVKEVESAQRDLIEKVRDLDSRLQSEFIQYDTTQDENTVKRMKDILSERSYIKSFLRQIESVLQNTSLEYSNGN